MRFFIFIPLRSNRRGADFPKRLPRVLFYIIIINKNVSQKTDLWSKKVINEFKELPNADTHNCFGCSPINAHGLQMKFYTDEESVFTWLSVPEHLCGWNNLVHGGVLSTILDEISCHYLLSDSWGLV